MERRIVATRRTGHLFDVYKVYVPAGRPGPAEAGYLGPRRPVDALLEKYAHDTLDTEPPHPTTPFLEALMSIVPDEILLPLKDRLADWADPDIAMFFLGKALGAIAPETPWWQAKGLFWGAHPMGMALWSCGASTRSSPPEAR
jgi:hypothetical protein